MTVRTNLATLTLLPCLDVLPTSNVAMAQYINSVLNPSVQITSTNCNTQLGLQVPASEAFSYIGNVLVDGTEITQAFLLTTPPSTVLNIRSLSTCTAPYGVCQACLATAGLSGTLNSYVTVPTDSANRYTYVLTLVQSFWGSLFTAAPIGSLPFQLPIRRQLYHPLVQPAVQNSFIAQLGFQGPTEAAVLNIQDPFEQFLVFAVYYAVGA